MANAMRRQFLVLRGAHNDKRAKLIKAADPTTLIGVKRKPNDGVFYKGDVIETDIDLLKNNFQGSVKFKRVDDSGPGDELEEKSVAELYELAATEEIQLPPQMDKTDLVIALRGALNYKSITSKNISSQTVQTTEEDEDGLEKMTVPKLREFAEESEIEIDDTMKKAEIINAIRGALAVA